jgi:predicted anti-sigma-YlaC factor YlaD
MKAWQRSLLWEGLPFLMLFGVFGLIAAVNWDYESKLVTPDPGASEWSGVYLGPILLAIAVAEAVAASVILLVVRLLWPAVTSSQLLVIPLTLVAILLIFPALFTVVLGPAAITMVEQMRVVPR